MSYPDISPTSDAAAGALFQSAVQASGLNVSGLSQIAQLQAAVGALMTAEPPTWVIPTTKLARSENAYVKTDDGVKDLLAAAGAARNVVIIVTVTTVFANGDGAQPTLTIGEESGSATKFAAAAKFTNAAAGATFAFAGVLTSGKKLQATLTTGTGSTETGAYTIDVIAVGG